MVSSHNWKNPEGCTRMKACRLELGFSRGVLMFTSKLSSDVRTGFQMTVAGAIHFVGQLSRWYNQPSQAREPCLHFDPEVVHIPSTSFNPTPKALNRPSILFS